MTHETAPARNWALAAAILSLCTAACSQPDPITASPACLAAVTTQAPIAALRRTGTLKPRGMGKGHNDAVRSIARHMLRYLPAAGSSDAVDVTVLFTALSKAIDDDSRERGISPTEAQLEVHSLFIDHVDASDTARNNPRIRHYADSLRRLPGVADRLAKRHALEAQTAAFKAMTRTGNAFIMAASDTVAFDAAVEDIGSIADDPDTTVDVPTIQSNIDSYVSSNVSEFASDTAAANGLSDVGEVGDSSEALWFDTYNQAWLDSNGTLEPSASMGCTSGGITLLGGRGANLKALPGWLVSMGHDAAKADLKGAAEGLLLGGQVIEGAAGASFSDALWNGLGDAAGSALGKRVIASAGNFVLGVIQAAANAGY